VLNGEQITIERPFEFFMPAGQKSDGQQWITSSMRLLSMVARSGGSIANSLKDLREVVWDKGPVRCGTVAKEDGSSVPRFHDSESAAIAYAIQGILMKRGFLDADGNQVPVAILAKKNHQISLDFEIDEEPMIKATSYSKCQECGSHSLRLVDGCKRCENCNYIGSCG